MNPLGPFSQDHLRRFDAQRILVWDIQLEDARPFT
jgi:hypothetical protein